MSANHITVNALRLIQRPDIPIYLFGVTGRLISQFTAVDFARRTDVGQLGGYQRPQIESHIRQIADYLESSGSLLPNAIILALGQDVAFRPSSAIQSEWGTPGTLSIPLPTQTRPQRSAWIVDGQQRVAALSRMNADRDFPVPVVGFVAASEQLQREQFVLVNRSKSLPRDLLLELLPDTTAPLPRTLQLQRFAGAVIRRLRFDRTSPFHGRVRGLGATEGASISQGSLVYVITHHTRRGRLFEQLAFDGSNQSVETVAKLLIDYYNAVRNVWPDEWEATPWSSRLVHGVGITAIGSVMDSLTDNPDPETFNAHQITRKFYRIKNRCAWTKGWWPSPLSCSWNFLQNTATDRRRLTEYLRLQLQR